MLRDYQQNLYNQARIALMGNRSVAVQLHTGAGKTPMMAAICDSVYGKDKRAWIVVPRKELLAQSSAHLRKWGVPHGVIAAGLHESRAFKIHVVSKDTLIRRYEKIKNWPDLLILDECHLYLDRQNEIISHLPGKSKVAGMSATPERLDGRGLWSGAGGVYDELIEGPSIPWLTERGFLSRLRYFSPPIDGLSEIRTRGMDYDEEQLEELLTRRKVYGELVGHYEKYGKGKAALIFCRSVKSAYQTAERFRDKGFNFHCIEGSMPDKRRRDLIQAHRDGTIDGLTNCDIATYGLDIPRIEYGASIRPTLSRALYFQMIGRILRPFDIIENDNVIYRKEEALFFDHVNLILEHQEPAYPGIPPHFVPHIEWNFKGTEKRKKDKSQMNIRLCPYKDFMYCNEPSCAYCDANPDPTIKDMRRAMVVIDTPLQEIEQPKVFNELEPQERREYQDRINSAIQEYRAALEVDFKKIADPEERSNAEKHVQGMIQNSVSVLLAIAAEFGYGVMWVYWRLSSDDRKTVNIPLLHEISRQKNYKRGWAWFKANDVRAQLEKKKKEVEEYKEAIGV